MNQGRDLLGAGASRFAARRASVPFSCFPDAQQGQALVEAAAVLGALCGVMLAVHATGAWQDEAMRVSLAARHVAFAYTRFDPVLGFEAEPDINVAMKTVLPYGLPDRALPGGSHAAASDLRREWGLVESQVMSAQSELMASHSDLAGWDMTLVRHTAILRDAGHAVGDAQAQRRVGQSLSAWHNAAALSIAAGRSVTGRMEAVERAWSRDLPGFDWLSDWSGHVPPEFLSTRSRQP